MTPLVLFVALLGLTSARPEVYYLPSGTPYLQARENVFPYASPIQINAPVAVPFVRIGDQEDYQLKTHTVEGATFGAESHSGQKEQVDRVEEKKVQQAVSNEQKILTPANTLLSPGSQPFASRQLIFMNGFPIPYVHSRGTTYSDIGGVTSVDVVTKQVFGSFDWDRKVIEWASKNCPHLPLLGGAVAGAGGGPIGIILGITGALIGSCNFNPPA